MPIHDFEVVSVGTKEQGSFPPSEFELIVRRAIGEHTPFMVTAVALLDELARRRDEKATPQEFEFRVDMLHEDPFSVNVRDTTTDQWTSIGATSDGMVHFSLIEP